MTVPKGQIWQDLRSACLDTIPTGCRTILAEPVGLADWQKSGTYTVQTTTKTRIEIVVSTDDFGSAILTDSECLLDHAAEHQVSLRKHIHSPDWLSPAWLGVTVYYWAYFLCLAITRLTGRTAWFLSKETARDFKRLAPVCAVAPGAGCFRLKCGQVISVTERLVELEKTDNRVHDEVWRLWFTACSERLAKCGPIPNGSEEVRLYMAFCQSARQLGNDWPSVFRNAINYRPGFAYTAVRRAEVLKSFSYLRQPSSYDMIEVLNRFEGNLRRLHGRNPIMKLPQVVLELLIDLTFLLHALTTELHAELVDRHRLDSRWRTGRRRFFRLNGLFTDGNPWPL